MSNVLLIALGGALGTLGRLGLSALTQRLAGPSFPLGTVSVNLVGCFLFGLVWAITEERAQTPPEVRLLVLTGFMGAFTTFSTFVFDSSQLLTTGRTLAFAANVLVQNAAGLGLLTLGLTLGRLVA